jgi:hypothetical protein
VFRVAYGTGSFAKRSRLLCWSVECQGCPHCLTLPLNPEHPATAHRFGTLLLLGRWLGIGLSARRHYHPALCAHEPSRSHPDLLGDDAPGTKREDTPHHCAGLCCGRKGSRKSVPARPFANIGQCGLDRFSVTSLFSRSSLGGQRRGRLSASHPAQSSSLRWELAHDLPQVVRVLLDDPSHLFRARRPMPRSARNASCPEGAILEARKR